MHINLNREIHLSSIYKYIFTNLTWINQDQPGVWPSPAPPSAGSNGPAGGQHVGFQDFCWLVILKAYHFYRKLSQHSHHHHHLPLSFSLFCSQPLITGFLPTYLPHPHLLFGHFTQVVLRFQERWSRLGTHQILSGIVLWPPTWLFCCDRAPSKVGIVTSNWFGDEVWSRIESPGRCGGPLHASCPWGTIGKKRENFL